MQKDVQFRIYNVAKLRRTRVPNLQGLVSTLAPDKRGVGRMYLLCHGAETVFAAPQPNGNLDHFSPLLRAAL